METETQTDHPSHDVPEHFWRETTEDDISEACRLAVNLVPEFLSEFNRLLDEHNIDLSDFRTEDAVFAIYLEAKIENYDRLTQLIILLALDLKLAKSQLFSLEYSKSISAEEVEQIVIFEREGYDPDHYLTKILIDSQNINAHQGEAVDLDRTDQSLSAWSRTMRILNPLKSIA